MIRVCKECKEEKSITEFCEHKGRRTYLCKSCRSKRVMENARRNALEIRKCRKCGIEKSIEDDYRNPRDTSCRACKDKKAEFKRIRRIEADKKRDKAEEILCRQVKPIFNYDYGLNDIKLPIEPRLGNRYEVESPKHGSTKVFDGSVIAITDSFFTMRKKNGIKESFLLNDIKLGEIQVREVRQ